MKKKKDADFFDEITRLQEEMNQSFNRIFESSKPLLSYSGQALQRAAGVRTPVSDVRETENAVIAKFEIPGVDKEEIQLNVNESSIEVKVEKKAEKEVKKKGMYSYASSSKSFYRIIPLPVEVKPEKAEASYKNGVLRVEIPKVKKIEGKKAGKRVVIR